MAVFQFYNPNPKGKLVSDCVKRCLVKATGEDYMDIQRQLNAIHRDLGTLNYQDPEVYKEFVSRRGYRKLSFPAERGKSRVTVRELAALQGIGADNLSDYNLICNCAHHLVCISEGCYWDTWDSGDKCVYTAYLVPVNEKGESLSSEIAELGRKIKDKEEELRLLKRKYAKLTGGI